MVGQNLMQPARRIVSARYEAHVYFRIERPRRDEVFLTYVADMNSGDRIVDQLATHHVEL